MKDVLDKYTNTILCGDCYSILKTLPSDSIDLVVTSPPYFQQRDYTGIGSGMEKNYNAYIETLLEVLIELARVIKPTGSIIYNIGDKIDKKKGNMLIPYRFALLALDNIDNLSLLNEITWVKKNPTPRQFNRRLVSATEPFFHFVKSSDYFYSVDDYMTKVAPPAQKPSDKLGQGYFKIIDNSDLTLAERQQAKLSVTDVIKEVVNGDITGFRVKIRGHHSPAFGGNDGGRNIQMRKNGFTIIKIKGKPMKKDYVISAVESIKGGEHPAVFPLLLIEEFIKLTCPVNSIVLDPYCGSGTTLLAATKQNKQYIGIDINPKYCNIAKQRVSNE